MARPQFTLIQIGLGLLLLISLLATSITPSPRAEAADETPTPTVTAPRAAAPLKATGNLISANQVSLAFPAGGRLQETKVLEGARVKTGDVIAVLDTAMLELQVAQAQAALDLANANWNRIKAGPSADDLAVAKSNLDRARAGVDQAQAAYDRAGGAANAFIGMSGLATNLQQATLTYQAAIATYNLTVNHPTTSEREVGLAQVAQAQAALDLAKKNLTNARLVAPFDGTVIWIGPKIGESVTANTAVVIIADLAKMQVQVSLDENSLIAVRATQNVTVTLDALGSKTLKGRVNRIGLLATATSNVVTTPITVDLDPTDAVIFPGLSALVEFQGR